MKLFFKMLMAVLISRSSLLRAQPHWRKWVMLCTVSGPTACCSRATAPFHPLFILLWGPTQHLVEPARQGDVWTSPEPEPGRSSELPQQLWLTLLLICYWDNQSATNARNPESWTETPDLTQEEMNMYSWNEMRVLTCCFGKVLINWGSKSLWWQ